MGAVVSAPPYILGRIAILMLGTQLLLIPGVVLLTFAAVLQAGATGAVKAVKMSTSLAAPRSEIRSEHASSETKQIEPRA
jgi:hypothetical protein